MFSIKQQTIHGVAWNSVGKFSNITIQFVIGIFLARLLTPEDYGIIGVLTIFMAIATTFVDSGFTSALIQKKILTDKDCSTAFFFNIVIGVIAYLILFFCAPWIAKFFNIPILVDITRVVALNVLIGAFTSVQQALYRKRVDFKTTAIVSIIATLLSGIISIFLAYNEFGVWSLVYLHLIYTIVTSVLLWAFSKWKPKWEFSWQAFHEMFSYGSKLLGASLLGIIYFHGEKLAIGKFYSTQELGLYTKGTGLSSQASSTFTGVLSSVTFPILAQIQEDNVRLIEVYKKYIRITSLVIFFLMLLLASLAKPIIIVLYGAKWSGAIIFLQIICLAMSFDHITSINLNLFYVKGRSDIVLKLEIIKRVISITILIAAIPLGVTAICISRVIYAQLALYINIYYTGKLFNYGYFKQWKDFGGYFIKSIISVTPAFILTITSLPNILVIIIGFILACVIYISILNLQKDSIFKDYVVKEIHNRFFSIKQKYNHDKATR